MTATLDHLPGYRRQVRIVAAPTFACAELEDDFHCMGVRIRHDGKVATAIEPVMARAPWATCPGAVEVLRATFTGVSLAAFASRGDKPANCTHLHDLVVLAAEHAFDSEPLTYDILVSDPDNGRRIAELRRNGVAMLTWTFQDGRFLQPTELAGLGLDQLRSWLESLDPPRQEMARLLRWASMVADGRTLSLEGEATQALIGSGICYSFQPQKLTQLKRTGEIRDFSCGTAQPLRTSPLAESSRHTLQSKREPCSSRFAPRRTS